MIRVIRFSLKDFSFINIFFNLIKFSSLNVIEMELPIISIDINLLLRIKLLVDKYLFCYPFKNMSYIYEIFNKLRFCKDFILVL